MLLLLAPPLLIALFYGWRLPTIQRNYQAAEAALQAAQKAQPAAAQFAVARAALSQAGRHLATVEQAAHECRQQWSDLESERSNDSRTRIRAIEGLTLLLKANDLELIDATPEEGADAQKLPPALEQVAKALGGGQASSRVQLWNVQFVGRYEDLVRALGDLAEEEPFAIPVHLKMEEAKFGTNIRRWTLVLWI